MIQEILTYIIVGVAVVFAVSKIFQKVGLKRKSVRKVNYQKDKISMQQHNCNDCSAECMLRSASKPFIEKNKELCKEIEIRQKL